jgi:hypothetical protein
MRIAGSIPNTRSRSGDEATIDRDTERRPQPSRGAPARSLLWFQDEVIAWQKALQDPDSELSSKCLLFQVEAGSRL